MKIITRLSSDFAQAIWRFRDFRLYATARFFALVSHQMIAIAIAQAVYEKSHNPLHLGYIGLALFLPKISLSLWAGHVADNFDRQKIILVCRVSQFLIVMGLIVFVWGGLKPLALVYPLLFLLGATLAFDGPASMAVVPQLVPREHLNRAITWNASLMQAAFILGPALGGFLYGLFGGALFVLCLSAGLRLISALLVLRMKAQTDHIEKTALSWETLLAGLQFIRNKRVILGAISMDLFAVLFGGAVALMPVYANDILKVGPSGLGLLRAAPAVGAILMALLLTRLPALKKSGKILFASVALFGVMTILFGISRSFIFSLFCLFVLGAADIVSVVIRGVLVQVETPPAMRGRVSAVNLVFIGASNELGEFESGLTASWFGTVPAVVLGGLGTLAVVGLWTKRFPLLWNYENPSS